MDKAPSTIYEAERNLKYAFAYSSLMFEPNEIMVIDVITTFLFAIVNVFDAYSLDPDDRETEATVNPLPNGKSESFSTGYYKNNIRIDVERRNDIFGLCEEFYCYIYKDKEKQMLFYKHEDLAKVGHKVLQDAMEKDLGDSLEMLGIFKE